jgi:hypothetical protein
VAGVNPAAKNVGDINDALVAKGNDQGLQETGQLNRRSMIRPHDLLKNSAVIVVVSLR